MSKAQTSKARRIKWWPLLAILLGLAIIAALLLYRLSHLMPGISRSEATFYSLPLGWHGLYRQPLNLPLKVLWSIIFKFESPVGQVWLRLPAVLTGAVAIVAFFILLKTWFNKKTATLGTILLASSAWTLHVSRIANFSVEYFCAVIVFLLSSAIIQKKHPKRYVYWLINLAWSLLLYVPGMVFLIAYNIFRQHGEIANGFSQQKGVWSKIVYLLSGLIWLPLLIRYFIRSPKNVLKWLGFPRHFAGIGHILKEFVAVFYHLFMHGPLLPGMWLGRSPVIDIFGIIAALTGVYFYIAHLKATRTHLVFVSLVIAAALVAIGGSVSLSLVIPLIYVLIATGIAYLLSLWLNVFPENPIARSLGYVLICLAVATSVIYNLRSYFVAWPHNSPSISVFDVKDKY